jgi:colanic acid biosynthesis glycosyl transferase WcaI
MKLLFLSQFFQPEPFFKALPFAKVLRAKGHEVEALTGFPNYPGGKVYEGYRVKLGMSETMEDVRVHRVPLYPSHDQNSKKRMLNYISFAVSATLLGPFRTGKPDVIYVYHPPGSVGLPAMWLRRLKGAALVYDIQDLWPDTIGSSGMMNQGRIYRTIDRWMKKVYRHCDRIVVLSPGFKRALIERGVPCEKIEVIYNWCDESQVQSCDPDPALSGKTSFKILFAGTMGVLQDLDHVLEAAKMTQDEGIEFVFVGGGVARAQLEESAKSIPNVTFLAARKPNEMGPLFAAADALLVHLKDDPLFRITIPSKTQAYLAVGKPILMAVKGDAADLVERSGAGLLAEPSNATSIADTARALKILSQAERNAMGERGKAFYQAELSMAVGVARFEEVFADALKTRRTR